MAYAPRSADLESHVYATKVASGLTMEGPEVHDDKQLSLHRAELLRSELEDGASEVQDLAFRPT